MVFHVRWIFLTTTGTSLQIPSESRSATRVVFGDEWLEIHLTWKTIPNALSRVLYTLNLIKLNISLMCIDCIVADHENYVRWIYLTTVLCMGEGQKYPRNLVFDEGRDSIAKNLAL